jgi:thymidylate kinase
VIVWIRIDPALQCERVAANRSQQQRHDATDAVLAEHVAGFEFPTDENPFVIDALDAQNHDTAAETANSIRGHTAR